MLTISSSDDDDDAAVLGDDIFGSPSKKSKQTNQQASTTSTTTNETAASIQLNVIMKRRMADKALLEKDLGEEANFEYHSSDDDDDSDDSDDDHQMADDDDDDDDDDSSSNMNPEKFGREIPAHLMTAMAERPNVERRKIAARALRRLTCLSNDQSSTLLSGSSLDYPEPHFNGVRIDISTFVRDVTPLLVKREKEVGTWLWSLVVQSRVEHAGFSMLASERMC